MREIKLLTLLMFISLVGFSQNKQAYNIFNAKGKKINYTKFLKSVSQANVILFGEQHNNPIAHWLQYELSYDLLQKGNLTFGAEMFEADNQRALNFYLKDSIDDKGLDSLARLWPNYKTDYAPLVNLAKDYDKDFIATNIPRRFANLVYKNGFEALDSLSEKEKEWIAPLPIEYEPELPGYKNILNIAEGHGGENLPKAQAIKDATMAFFISENLKTDTRFIHFNGTYHSNNYEGIVWYLSKHKPNSKIITIATISQEQVNKLDDENKYLADFIICVDEDMTTTY